MGYDFDTAVDRRGFGSLKRILCPQPIADAGLLSYSGAEMEFPTAPAVTEAVIARARAGLPSFTLCDAPYRAAVRWWMSTQRGLELAESWILPTHGTIFSLATAIRMATRPGDSIIVQPPVYNRYEQAAKRLGRGTLYNHLTEQGGRYQMDLQGLEALMARSDAKILVLCNPQNPTGNVWQMEELAAIAALANRYGVLVYSDEIFAEVCFQHRCPSYLEAPGAHGHAMVATSLGKCFSFTGVNHANVLIADEGLMARFRAQRDADHYGSIDPWAYSALLGAYSPEGAAWKDAMLDYVQDNIKYISDFFRQHLPAVRMTAPAGSYVLWIDWSGLGLSDTALLDFLEKHALLHLSPGAEYYAGRPCLTRMCIAVPRHELERSLELLLKAADARNLAAD